MQVSTTKEYDQMLLALRGVGGVKFPENNVMEHLNGSLGSTCIRDLRLNI